jgi:hypothetical protein
MVFHFQNVEETYTTVQRAFQLSNIQAWLNAALTYRTDCYSPLFLNIFYRLKIRKTSRPRPSIHYVLGPQTLWS